jgi:hypothetical protein
MLTIRSLAAGPHAPGTVPRPFTGKVAGVHLLRHLGSLPWTQKQDGLAITLPARKPCDHAFAFKFIGAAA